MMADNAELWGWKAHMFFMLRNITISVPWVRGALGAEGAHVLYAAKHHDLGTVGIVLFLSRSEMLFRSEFQTEVSRTFTISAQWVWTCLITFRNAVSI
jgi:hypothetical protein